MFATRPSPRRGSALLLRHLTALVGERPTAYTRLEREVGPDLARLLVWSLTRPAGGIGSSSPETRTKRKIRKPATQPAMKAMPPEMPTATPPIQMKSPRKNAHRKDVIPCAIEGGRRCMAAGSLHGQPARLRPGPKIHRAGGASVHLPREPSASAYGPRERLRPTRAPCSVQEAP